jgi:hypothetical protein
MSDLSKFNPTVEFDNKEIFEANTNILNRVTQALFVFYMPEGGIESPEEIEDLADQSFEMASVVMAVAGMNIVGENIDGDYVARFKPYESFSDFAIKNNI